MRRGHAECVVRAGSACGGGRLGLGGGTGWPCMWWRQAGNVEACRLGMVGGMLGMWCRQAGNGWEGKLGNGHVIEAGWNMGGAGWAMCMWWRLARQ
jgi:hypothetical protein